MSLIGAYCNKLYDFGKDIVLFHSMAELKHTAQPRNLMSHLQIRKVSHQIVKRAYHYMPFTFNCQNDHHLGFVIIID